MVIRNRTRKTVLAREVEVAKGFWKKTLGLMFRKGVPEDYCFLMEFGKAGFHSVWMLGMRFPIDIVFLDKDNRVVGLFRNARPFGIGPATWRTYRPSGPAKRILELKAGSAERSRTSKGDSLDIA